MDLDHALELLRTIVKENGVNGEKHIDFGLVSTVDRPTYQKALIVAQLAMKEGTLTKTDFERRTNLE